MKNNLVFLLIFFRRLSISYLLNDISIFFEILTFYLIAFGIKYVEYIKMYM